MQEVYAGKRGSAVTVADPAAAATRYQRDLMEDGTGWFQIFHADGAITLAPIGLGPLTFETEGNIVLESVRPTQESQDEPNSDLFRCNRESKGKLKFAC